MNYTCPVCGFDSLEYPPEDFAICPSCGTEFGLDDANYTIEELRARWIKGGSQWWSISDSFPIQTELKVKPSMRIIILDSHTTEGFKEIDNTNKEIESLKFVRVRFPNIVFKGELLHGKSGSMSSNTFVPVNI
jgi:hypothetical protein